MSALDRALNELERIQKALIRNGVQAIIWGAVDHVESMFPPYGYDADEWDEFEKFGGLNVLLNDLQCTVGWQLSILYAQITGDGMGVGDAIEVIHFDDFMERFCKDTITYLDDKVVETGALTRPKHIQDEMDKMIDDFTKIITDMLLD